MRNGGPVPTGGSGLQTPTLGNCQNIFGQDTVNLLPTNMFIGV